MGTQIVVENLSHNEVTLSVLGDRVRHPARGVLGGGAGQRAIVLRNDVPIDPKGLTRLAPGDRLVVRNAGGGGYGPPAARPRSAVHTDLVGGYITMEGTRCYDER